MLKQRIITGLILVLFLFAAIFFVPPIWFFLILIAVGAAGSIEWASMSESFGRAGSVIFPLAVIAGTLILYVYRDFALLFNLAGVALWLLLATTIFRTVEDRTKNAWLTASIAVAAISLAVYAIADLLATQQYGAYWLAGMFILVGVADSAAFFSGRRFGKTKLAPRISPGKTREGLIGSLLSVWVLSLACGALIWRDDYSQLFLFAVVCFACALFSVVGDLYISLQKRIHGVKDSGSLLPGHGGILDRIDSTLAVAPLYALCVNTMLT